jgi:CDP-4-dehydro-6-deoxyglucose reductase
MFSITLVNGKRFDAPPDISILEAARAAGLALEHSCRTGRCGLCRATVCGETSLIQSELPTEGLQPGEILTCCRAAASDLTLDIADLGRLAGIEKRILPCKIAGIDFPAPTIAHVVLRLPPTARFAFLAGQYIDIIAKGVKRSYSIANSPRVDGSLELYIRRFDGGVLSRYWFEEAAVGDLLRFEGPLGTFFLRDEGQGPLIFLATGTGIAPVRALLEDVAATAPSRPVFAFWGNRAKDDFFWSPTPEAGQIRFETVLSRPDAAWTGPQGYVQDALLMLGLDLGDASVYACGSEDMIRSAERQLMAASLPKHRFFADPFLSSE